MDGTLPSPPYDPRPIPAARLTAPVSEPAGILSRGAIASQRADRDAIIAADAECACAYRAAETLAILLDRHAGDAGSDPDALGSVTDRINDMVAEVRTLLGEPATPVWRNGECVALVRNPRP